MFLPAASVILIAGRPAAEASLITTLRGVVFFLVLQAMKSFVKKVLMPNADLNPAASDSFLSLMQRSALRELEKTSVFSPDVPTLS